MQAVTTKFKPALLATALLLGTVSLNAQAATCPAKISTEDPEKYYLVVQGEKDSTNPSGLRLHWVVNGEQNSSYDAIERWLRYMAEELDKCRGGNQGVCAWHGGIATLERQVEVARCHLNNASATQQSASTGGKPTSLNSEDLDVVTPQVPGCPRYLRKNLVEWSRVGNPQLNLWEVTNVSEKTLKITYRESGTNTSPDTLPPGQSTQVSTQSSSIPPYVVRDFKEMKNFEQKNPQKKSLQCSLSIRPQ